MPIIRTKPSEFLVVAERGRLASRGAAASRFVPKRTAWVKVPGDQQEARFEMTQETRDGIPLRFKGSAVLRIVRPEAAAQLFDFTTPAGLEALKTLAGNACLGELRDRVSHMTMKECIEERKTTLTEAVRTALLALVGGEAGGWGVALDSVLVAQVFIVDQDLRRQLEAETRGRIQSASDLAELSARESVELAKITSVRRVQQESLETERQRIALDRQKHALEVEAEREKHAAIAAAELAAIEADTPVQLARSAKRLEVLRAEKEALELERQVEEIGAAKDFIRRRAEHEMRRDILPIEQAPQIVESASRLFQGARLSFYGGEARLMEVVQPVLDVLADALRGTGRGGPGEGPAPA